MELPVVLKKQQEDFPRVNYKQHGNPEVRKNKRGVTQFCRVSRGEALFCLEFPGKNLKNPKWGGGSKKYVLVPPSPPLFVFFLKELNSQNLERENILWQWRNSQDKERSEENVDQMKRHVEVIRELKTGRRLTDQNLKHYLHLKCYHICLRYMSFLAGFFYSWFSGELL